MKFHPPQQIRPQPSYALSDPPAKRPFFIAYMSLKHWHDNISILSKAETRKLVHLRLLCEGYDPKQTALGIPSGTYEYQTWLFKKGYAQPANEHCVFVRKDIPTANLSYKTLHKRYKPLLQSVLNPDGYSYMSHNF